MASIAQVLKAFLEDGQTLPKRTRSGLFEATRGANGMPLLWLGGRLMAMRYGSMVNMDRMRQHTAHYEKLKACLLGRSEFKFVDRWAAMEADTQPSEFMAWGRWYEAEAEPDLPTVLAAPATPTFTLTRTATGTTVYVANDPDPELAR